MSDQLLDKIETLRSKSELSREELTEIGGAVLESTQRTDFDDIVAKHVEMTGKPHTNEVGRELQFAGMNPEGKVIMQGDKAYRSVDGRAVRDLIESGVVRGARIAGKENVNTNGNTTFWAEGVDGNPRHLGGGFTIEAGLDDAKNGWVTADKVTGLYAKDKEGAVHNLLDLARAQAVDSADVKTDLEQAAEKSAEIISPTKAES